VIANSKLRRFWSLDRSGRALVREALLLPLLISMSFRLKGVPWTQAELRRWATQGATGSTPATSSEAADWIALAQLGQRSVRRAAGVGGNCLVRSLTLWTMLLRRGVVTDLRVGVRRREGKIEAHAWLEFAGMPVNENQENVDSYSVYDQPLAFDAWHNMK
jgi:hypothetical protein